MTTYAKYRILLFSLELTDGKFVRVIISKMAAPPLRRKRFSTRCGVPPMSSMSEKVRVTACRLFRKSTRSNAEESLANAEGFPCKGAKRQLARLEG